MNRDFYQVLKNRRSYYAINNESPLSDKDLVIIIKALIDEAPTAFNCQSSKAALLLGEQHHKLWQIVMRTLKAIVPEKAFAATENKINSFNAGYGTILFFDDAKITSELIEKYPLYKDNFLPWAEQSNGMLQYAIWSALELEGYGASLQHYNPLIDNEVKATWNIPKHWRLTGQMPFGKPISQPPGKEMVPIEQKFMVFK